MPILWPAETGTDFLAIFLKCHLFQYEEKRKFRNELEVFPGDVIGSFS